MCIIFKTVLYTRSHTPHDLVLLPTMLTIDAVSGRLRKPKHYIDKGSIFV